jgi:hypothetical protein
MTAELCHDCKTLPATAHFGTGVKRCEPCAETYRAILRAKRKEKDDAATCDVCDAKTGNYMQAYCSDCCEHGEFDHGICMDCGLDCTEEMAAAAYDRAKDFQKYGE